MAMSMLQVAVMTPYPCLVPVVVSFMELLVHLVLGWCHGGSRNVILLLWMDRTRSRLEIAYSENV